VPAARRDEPRPRREEPVPPARKRSALLIALPGIGVFGIMLMALLYFLLTGFRPPPGHATAPHVAGPVPTPYRKAEIAQGLREIRSDDAKARSEAARRFAVTPVHEDLRPEVAEALEEALGDAGTRAAVASALGAWGDRDSADKLLPLVGDADADVREATMLALAALKDERAADAIAARLADSKDRHSAGTALRKLGPLAENSVVKYTEPDQELATRITALGVLQSGGTRASLPLLDRLAGDGDRRIGVAAAGAAATIRARHPDPADGGIRSEKGKKA
jgi:HEAT repeat protein